MYDRESLLKQIMAHDFTTTELNLYLDTHPYDQRAIAMYNNNLTTSKMLKATYEKMFGPLSVYSSYNNSNYWQWIQSPWPWEC